MTPEQKQQRIEQIRKDAVESYGFRNHTPAGHEPLIEQACEDIDFLLSLVESQEALPDPAIAMRSRCVEKVKAKETALREIAEGAEKAGNMIWSKSALAQAECAKQIWQALESVSIQEQASDQAE